MEKNISLERLTLFEGVILGELRFVGRRCSFYEDLPSKAVLVAYSGSRFSDLGLVKDMDLGWAKFFYARLPGDWGGLYDEYLYERDLPVFCGFALNGMAVEFRTARTGREILVVSEKAWHGQREEVKSFLLEAGYAIPEEKLGEMDFTLTLGGDPEFEAYVDGKIVPAVDIPIFRRGGYDSPIGLDADWCAVELRPAPAYSEEEYAENFLALVERVREEGILLSVQGDRFALGGHIHIGSPNPFVARVLREGAKSFVKALDDFVGRVLLPTSGKARGEYKCLGAYEIKNYGWEYKTPPSSFYADLEALRIVYKLVRNLVETLLRERELSYEILANGRVKPEEYHRFLTPEETEYFLGFPERWARGEIPPFVPMAAVFVAAG
jgi:hypothetical protein